MVEHEEEPKRFSPKVPVKLDPPKYDPISAEELSKCDGMSDVPVILFFFFGLTDWLAQQARILTAQHWSLSRESFSTWAGIRHTVLPGSTAVCPLPPSDRQADRLTAIQSLQERTHRGVWRVRRWSQRTADPIGMIWTTKRRPCWMSGSPSSASDTTLLERCRMRQTIELRDKKIILAMAYQNYYTHISWQSKNRRAFQY